MFTTHETSVSVPYDQDAPAHKTITYDPQLTRLIQDATRAATDAVHFEAPREFGWWTRTFRRRYVRWVRLMEALTEQRCLINANYELIRDNDSSLREMVREELEQVESVLVGALQSVEQETHEDISRLAETVGSYKSDALTQDDLRQVIDDLTHNIDAEGRSIVRRLTEPDTALAQMLATIMEQVRPITNESLSEIVHRIYDTQGDIVRSLQQD